MEWIDSYRGKFNPRTTQVRRPSTRVRLLLAGLAMVSSASLAIAQTAAPSGTKAGTRPPAPRTAQREGVQTASDQRYNTAAPRATNNAQANGEAMPATGRAAAQPSTTGKAGPPVPRGAAAGPKSGAGAGQVVPPVNMAPREPFTLTESQQKLLDQIVRKWEQESNKVKTFRCGFTRWEYDPAWGPKEMKFQKSEGAGEIYYKAPDHGKYEVKSLQEFDAAKQKFVAKTEGLDNWVCDGEAIYEVDSQQKRVVKRELPPELRGKAISDGPLPFIFGAKADQLKRRYWMRDVTPKDEVGKNVWLEAHPKFQQDALNFQRATVILREKDFIPVALQIYLPDGKSNTAYTFDNPKANAWLDNLNPFEAPIMTPAMRFAGWKYVVEAAPKGDAAEEAPPASTPPAVQPAQAKRPTAPTQRK